MKVWWTRLAVGYGAGAVVFLCGYINAIHIAPGEFRYAVNFLIPFFFGVSFLPASSVFLDWMINKVFLRRRQEAGENKAPLAALILSAIALVLMLFFFRLMALKVLYASRAT